MLMQLMLTLMLMRKIAGMATDSKRTTVLWVHDQQGRQALADVEVVEFEDLESPHFFYIFYPRYNKALNISPPSSPESTVNIKKTFHRVASDCFSGDLFKMFQLKFIA